MGGRGRIACRNELIRAGAGLLACVLAFPAWGDARWQVMTESPAETVSIELSSLERVADRVSFRVRHALRDGQLEPGSQRTMREILSKRMVDCRGRRMAILSRAVFSDNDAIISYQAVHPQKAEWQPMAMDDPLFKRVCGSL